VILGSYETHKSVPIQNPESKQQTREILMMKRKRKQRKRKEVRLIMAV